MCRVSEKGRSHSVLCPARRVSSQRMRYPAGTSDRRCPVRAVARRCRPVNRSVTLITLLVPNVSDSAHVSAGTQDARVNCSSTVERAELAVRD